MAKFNSSNFYLFIVLAAAYSLGLNLVVNSSLNDIFYIPVIWKRINIPVASLILSGLYIWGIYFFKKSFKDNSPFIFQGAILGFLMNQYLLFVRLFDMIFTTPLAKIYLGYIVAAFLIITFLVSFWSFKIIGNLKGKARGFSRAYFLPVVFLPVWAVVNFSYKGYILLATLALFSFASAFFAYKLGFLRYLSGLIKRIYSDKKKAVVFLFALTFIFRFAFSANVILKTEYANPPVKYVTASDDGPTYDNQGKLLAQDFSVLFRDSIITPGAWEPGYGIFLSFLYRVFGHNFFIVGIAQAVLASLVTLFCFSIGVRVFDYRTAFIAACLIALNQSLIFIFGTLNVEVTYIFLIYLSLWLLISSFQDKKKYPGVIIFISGLIFGLAAITRGVILLFPIFIFIWMFIKSLARKAGFILPLINLSRFSLGMCLVLLAMSYVNYLNVGKFILTNKGDAYLTASGVSLKDYHYEPKISPGNSPFIDRGFDLSKPSLLLKNIAKRPADFGKAYLEVVPTRIKNFFFWPEHGFFDPVMLFLDANPFMENLMFYAVLMFLTGLILLFVKLSPDKFLVFSLVAYYALLHSTIGFVETVRFRVPVVPFIIIITSFGISWLAAKVLQEQRETN